MTDELGIGKRMKELRKEHHFSQAYVAEKLFVSQAAYSLMESGRNGVSSEQVVRLSKLYNVTADYLLTGNKKLVDPNPKNGFIPLIDVKAHAGYVKNLYHEDVLDDFEYYRIPGYNPTADSFLVEVEGDSMQPTIMSSDVLICQIQQNKDRVLDGSIAVVVTKSDLIVKRLFKHEDPDYFWVESDNPEKPGKKQMRKSQIKQLLMVRGKVSNVLIPHREQAFKGKLQAMEESLESLGKEVYRVNKKVESLNKRL